MKKIVFILCLNLLNACAHYETQDVDEWNSGYPQPGFTPQVDLEDNSKLPLNKFIIQDLGKSVYLATPKGNIQTHNKLGVLTPSVILTNNKDTKFYSLGSFEPVIVAMIPETKENFIRQKKFSEWSGYCYSASLSGVVAISSIIPNAVGILTPVLLQVAAHFNGMAENEFLEIKNKYNSLINSNIKSN